MQKTYSFIKPLSMLLSEHLRDSYPGLPKIASVYFNNENDELLWHLSVKGQENQSFAASKELNELRKPLKQGFHWLDKDSIPISEDISNKSSFNIFDESDKLVLCMRFTNPFDLLQDIIYAEFSKENGVFGIRNSNETITPEKKAIIGEFVYSGLLSIAKRHQNDYDLWHKLSNQVRFMHAKSEEYHKALLKEQEASKRSVERLVKEYVKGFSIEFNRNIILSNEAQTCLNDYRGDLFVLRDIIKDSIIFASNLTVSNTELLIQASYINFSIGNSINETTSTIAKKESTNTSDKGNRENRATQYLYRLSKAVEKLLSEGEKITGSNVGKVCSPPVSAPAISEFLTKYRKTINNILLRDPNKWQLLTRHFKPISNILDSTAAIPSSKSA